MPVPSPATIDVPPVFVTFTELLAPVIALTWMPLKVIASIEELPLPLIVSVIVDASVRTEFTEVMSVPVKDALPAEVNSKSAGAERINVPNAAISPAAPSVITTLPSPNEDEGNAQVVIVRDGAVIVTAPNV